MLCVDFRNFTVNLFQDKKPMSYLDIFNLD